MLFMIDMIDFYYTKLSFSLFCMGIVGKLLRLFHLVACTMTQDVGVGVVTCRIRRFRCVGEL